MKRNFIIYIAIGLFTGFILGHFVRKSHLTSNSPQTETKEQSVKEDRANRKSQPQTQPQKIATLTSRIENLQRRLEATRLKAERYDKVRELWKQEGFGAGVSFKGDRIISNTSIFEFAELMPSDALIDFFGWDDATVAEIDQLGSNLKQETLDWEMEQAVCTKPSANELVIEIPEAPSKIRDQYQHSLRTLLGTEDAELFLDANRESLNKELNQRKITIRRIPAGENSHIIPNEEDSLFGLDAEDPDSIFGHGRPVIQESISVSLTHYENGNMTSSRSLETTYNSDVFARWQYLIGENPF